MEDGIHRNLEWILSRKRDQVKEYKAKIIEDLSSGSQ
jgi:hypothetical protein